MSASPRSAAYTVGPVAVLVAAVTDTAAAGVDGRVTVEVYNAGSGPIFMGGEDVTVETGSPLVPGAARAVALRLSGKIWAVAATTQDVRVLVVP